MWDVPPAGTRKSADLQDLLLQLVWFRGAFSQATNTPRLHKDKRRPFQRTCQRRIDSLTGRSRCATNVLRALLRTGCTALAACADSDSDVKVDVKLRVGRVEDSWKLVHHPDGFCLVDTVVCKIGFASFCFKIM